MKKYCLITLTLFLFTSFSYLQAQGSGSSTDCPCETKDDSTGLCTAHTKPDCADSDNGKCCCSGEEFDKSAQCCKGGSIENLWEKCIHSVGGGKSTSGKNGHSFTSQTDQCTGDHETSGTRRGDHVNSDHAEKGKEKHSGKHDDYEKDQYRDKGKDYPGSKRCKMICGKPPAIEDPGYKARGPNCTTYAADDYNNAGGDDKISGSDKGTFVDNPGALQDSIDEKNKKDGEKKEGEESSGCRCE